MSPADVFGFAVYGICGVAALVCGWRDHYAAGTYYLCWAILIRITLI